MIFALLVFINAGAPAQQTAQCDTINRFLVPGEELVYLARFSFINLGEVKFVIEDTLSIEGKKTFKTTVFMDSYEGLPFVSLHQVYESVFDQNFNPYYFHATIKEEDTTFTEYKFNYEDSTISIKKGRVSPYTIWTDSTAVMDSSYQDGLSIFYFARMNFGSQQSMIVPSFVAERKVDTKINYYTDVTGISIEAIDYDVACLKLDGETGFVSVFGLTGYFEAWFSDDEASIPILAKLNVIIGNITLELIEWNREGWSPPEYKE